MNWENDGHLFVAHGIIAFSVSTARVHRFPSPRSAGLEVLLVGRPLNDKSCLKEKPQENLDHSSAHLILHAALPYRERILSFARELVMNLSVQT